MIPRYTRDVMETLWSQQRKLEIWLDVELAAVEGWAELGIVPKEAAAHIREHAVLDPERIAEIEAITRHDVAAFIQSLEEFVGEEYGRWIHFGMTSSDVLDTTLAIAEVLHEEFGDPRYAPPPLLRRMVELGRMGKKSGRGFYDYSK